jgi:uncharacterized protein
MPIAAHRPPDEAGVHRGLAWAVFRPAGAPRGSVLVLHGAGSAKENHFAFARACAGGGLAALCFDQRGHGESAGALGAGAIEDVVAMAGLLPPGPVGLRGSSMGGYLALVAAAAAGAAAVVALCPASNEGLLRGLRAHEFEFRADRRALEELLETHDAGEAAAALDVPVLLLHAEGDERVPVEHSRELARVLRAPGSRLIAVPGGHHRSVQHDAELQAVSVRWLARALAAA